MEYKQNTLEIAMGKGACKRFVSSGVSGASGITLNAPAENRGPASLASLSLRTWPTMARSASGCGVLSRCEPSQFLRKVGRDETRRPERSWALGFGGREAFDNGMPRTCSWQRGIALVDTIRRLLLTKTIKYGFYTEAVRRQASDCWTEGLVGPEKLVGS